MLRVANADFTCQSRPDTVLSEHGASLAPGRHVRWDGIANFCWGFA